MRLTKLQRHTAYIILLSEFEYEGEGQIDFFCEAMDKLFDWGFSETPLKEHFPELFIKRPKTKNGFTAWFEHLSRKGGRQRRIELLNQCIEETY